MSGSERKRELRRRRHRQKKVPKLVEKASNASGGERAEIAQKLRRLTPGAEVIIAAHNLEG